MTTTNSKTLRTRHEQGFMLVGLIVAIFIILLVLGVAAPTVAKQLRRDREVEAVHRGNQYVRAVQLYYRKVGRYPGSIDQLEKSNNIRFLRQQYADPMTGKPDWRLIHMGEAKTTVKGFFGQPLGGIPGSSGGTGSAAGQASNGTAGSGATGSGPGGSAPSSFGSSSFGASGSSGSPGSSGSSFGSSSFGSSSAGGGGSGATPGAAGSSGGGFGSSNNSAGNGSTGISSQSATSFSGTGAPIMGVGSVAAGDSILDLNEQTTYPTWEFIYDPRIEQMKARASLLGGGASSTGSSSFGSSATSPGLGGATIPGINGSGNSGFGSGNSGSSGFGSGSGFGGTNSPGASPGASGSGTPTTPPQ